MSILNVDKIQPIGGGSTITVDATDIQATSATITASKFVGSGDLSVTGVSTFTGNIDANGDLDVDGHTNLDNVSVAGVTTFTDAVRIVKTAGPLLELTTNTGAADATLRLSEGATGSTTNGGGMFYSGADNKLHITCGTNSTTKRISILRDTGLVGIGTENPSVKLHVSDGSIRSSNTAGTNFTELGSDGNIEIKRTGGSAYIDFADATGNDADCRIQHVSDGFDFSTGGQGSRTTKLRIDSGGRLYTGASTQLLDATAGTIHIDGGTSGGRIALRGTTTSAGGGLGEIFAFWNNNKVAGIIALAGSDTTNKDDGHLTFYTRPDVATGVQERARIDSSGRLLLGTTTEGHANGDDLTIATSGDTGITLRSGTSGAGNIYFSDATSGGGEYQGFISYGHNVDGMYFATSTSTRMFIASDGKVGIGIVSPDSLLHLEGSGSTAKIKLQRTGTTIGGSIQTRDGSNDKGLTYIAKDGNSAYPNHVFQTDVGSGGVERMRITHNGQLTIGAAAPTFNNPQPLLNIEKTSTGTGPLIFLYNGQSATTASTCEIRVGQNYREANRIVFGRENNNNWQASAGSVASYMAFHTNSAGTIHEALRITSDRKIDTGSKTITGGTSLAIQNFRVKGIWSGSPSIGKEIELISGYDGSVKMAAIGYNLTDTGTGSTYGGDLVFHTQPLYSSPTTPIPETMRISSSGYITKTKQPRAHVLISTQTQLGNSKITAWASPTINVSSFWDSTNKRFVAPCAGVYMFGGNFRIGAPGHVRVVKFNLQIYNSGGTHYATYGGGVGGAHNYDDSSSGWDHPYVSFTNMIQLSKADYVELHTSELAVQHTSYIQTNNNQSGMWGFLLM